MAKRAQTATAKRPQGESQPPDRWWRSPTVVAAIITAVAAISVAFIQFSGPKSKPSEVTKIEPQTHGPGSPAVGHTGGNVTIHQESGGQKP
jgi:hypothetical protein